MTPMTLEEITTWIHLHVATVTIVSELEEYTGLNITVTANAKSATITDDWDPVVGMGEVIRAFEKEHSAG